ncbi:hypothetical protein T484DRAFT_1937123, partial [Baffinella frigidus]
MHRSVLIIGASLPLVAGFIGTGPALRPAGTTVRSSQSGLCAMKASVETRREVLGRAATVGAALLFGASPAFAKGKMIEKDDDVSVAVVRYSRQPTRLDVERCVPLMVAVDASMKAAAAALEAGDTSTAAEALGDQTVESTKRNVSLGNKISAVQVAKPVMTRFAKTFSKGNPSSLTKELLEQVDLYFPAVQKAQELSVAGDLDGAKASFAEAEAALNAYVDLVEAETRDGRLNSVKISVGVLVGKVE